MNIAILTQPLVSNYGGILQAFALQVVLRGLGHNVITIDRCKGVPTLKEFLYRCGSFFKCVIRRYLMGNKEYVLNNPFKRGDYSVFPVITYDNSALQNFISKNIVLSDPIYNTRKLKAFIEKSHFDCFIVGSDQVWREAYSPRITNYFFDFLENKKGIKRYAYAASFGVQEKPLSKRSLRKCKHYLKEFDGVTVRENSGVIYLREAFNYTNASVVLDPTLLLSADVYFRLIKEEDYNKFGGLTSYVLDIDKRTDFIITDIQKRMDKPYTKLSICPVDKNGTPGSLVSISKWLAAIAYADFVVTDSFHGCVFSILFKKSFVVIGNEDRGIDRFVTLLDSLGLSNHLVSSYEEYVNKVDTLLTPIDYEKVYSKYNQLKVKSLEFIRNL